MKRRGHLWLWICAFTGILILILSLTNSMTDNTVTPPKPMTSAVTPVLQTRSEHTQAEDERIHKQIQKRVDHSTPEVIVPIIDKETVSFNGQSRNGFTLQANQTAATQTLVINMENTGRSSFTYQLVDPAGTECSIDTIKPDKQKKIQYTWINQQAGDWTIRISNKDGSPGSFSYAVQTQS
ncbi:hypothetical protein [Paenibacillus shenyangensis]|uniref:hypothetical protein n=1 Tax=Paenibacillus sp. A9 TaxID=1284352 RepID=UPI00037F0B2B|nr:hypothetical protein [Paenibacillus sp. A9]